VTFSWSSTSTRTFLVLPAVALAEAAAARRRPRLRWLPLLPWGYLQYRLGGRYRSARGGGGPGMGSPPERLVTTGVYALTRNPMYLGHLVFLTGLSLTTRSRLAAAATLALLPWFDARAARDEQALAALFGEEYARYCESVPRWLARTRGSRAVRPPPAS
jgi:hypothetical protein